MTSQEMSRLQQKIGNEAAAMVYVLRKVANVIEEAAESKPEPFYSVLQSAEDERKQERNANAQ